MNSEKILDFLKNNLKTAKEGRIDDMKHVYLRIDASEIVKAAKLIKEHFKSENILLEQIIGTDLPESKEMELIYTWWLIDDSAVLFNLKITIPYDKLIVPTISDIWTAANWHEREIHEMLGIKFEGHPNLTIFLLHEELWGKYPLRKSYVPEARRGEK